MNVVLTHSVTYRRIQYAIKLANHKPFAKIGQISGQHFFGIVSREIREQAPRFRKLGAFFQFVSDARCWILRARRY